ncbi:hypothetical protein ACOSQ4_004730 [Xanthoceras sorbifolium]
MQAFSTLNDVLPGSIRASDQVVNVERQLPTAQPNIGGQPQMSKEHANISNERVFDSRTQQAVAPMLNTVGGLHGSTTSPRLQIPPLAMGGTTHRSPLIPKTLVTSSTSTPHNVELVNPNLLASNSDVACRFAKMKALIQRIPGMPTPIKKSAINSFADSPFEDALVLVKMPRKFNFPNMKQYDGMTYPNDHIAEYSRGCSLLQFHTILEKPACAKALGQAS